MMDTSIAIRGVTLEFKGQCFEMVKAGFANDIPYAEVKPRNEAVEKTIVGHIKKNMPFPFSLDAIQNTLAKTK